MELGLALDALEDKWMSLGGRGGEGRSGGKGKRE